MATQTQAQPKAETKPGVVTIEVKKSVFDLDSMERKTVEKKLEVTPIATREELAQFDSDSLVELVKLGQLEKARQDAYNSIQGADAGAINTVIRPMRGFPMFNSEKFYDKTNLDESGKPTLKRKEQTQAIMQWLKAQPEMFEQIKLQAEAISGTPAVEEDENDDESESEKA